MPNFLTKPFYSQIGLIIMTIIQMALNIGWILLYVPTTKHEKEADYIFWYFLACGSVPTLLPAMAILISSFRRRGRWPIRWGAVFILAGWFVLTPAVGLTIKQAAEDTSIYNAYANDHSPTDDTTFQDRKQEYKFQSTWRIAASTTGMISMSFTLYYCIVLLVLRKTLSLSICNYYSSEEIKSFGGGFSCLQDEEGQRNGNISHIQESNNKHDQGISSCSRRTRCCCFSVPSVLRIFLICLGYMIYFGIVGGFSVLILTTG